MALRGLQAELAEARATAVARDELSAQISHATVLEAAETQRREAVIESDAVVARAMAAEAETARKAKHVKLQAAEAALTQARQERDRPPPCHSRTFYPVSQSGPSIP